MRIYILTYLLINGIIFSQVDEDVVLLKNDTIIRGSIIELTSNNHTKIQSGMNVIVSQIDEIEKLTKGSIDISDNSWSIQAGFGTHRSFSLLAISKDYKLNNFSSLFITAGIGTAAIGAGISFQNNFNDSGLNCSIAFGAGPLHSGFSLNGNISYQWRVKHQVFISAGLMIGSVDHNIESWDVNPYQYILPMVATDFRF